MTDSDRSTADRPPVQPGAWNAPPPGDVDVARVWAESGAAHLTAGSTVVPATLVRRLDGVIAHLAHHDHELRSMLPAGGLGILTERAAHLRLPPATRRSCGGMTRLLRTASDDIALCLARPDDVELLPAWLGGDPVPGDPWPTVAAAVADRDAEQLIGLGGDLGIPVARLGECDDRQPLYAARHGAAPRRSIEGLVVLDLASLWAGPLCANLLQRAGARVIKVESRGRPDGARHHPSFFAALHDGQRGIAFDFSNDRDVGRLRRLIERADVVIEGSRPRALRQHGIVAEQVVTDGPQVWVSITGHGRGPASAQRVGFGDDAAVAGGLIAGDADRPLFLADAIADPLTGLLAASAVIDLIEQGDRWLVDAALARAATSMVGASTERIECTVPVALPRTRSLERRPARFRDASADIVAEFDLDH